MAVAKRRRTKIVVHGETFYWQVTPHIPYDEDAWLVVLSSDKKLDIATGPVNSYCWTPESLLQLLGASRFFVEPRFTPTDALLSLAEQCLANSSDA